MLEIESFKFTADEIMKNIDKCVLKVIKSDPELAKRSEEILEIFEAFLIDVGSSKNLDGGLEE